MLGKFVLGIALILAQSTKGRLKERCQDVRWTGGESINWPCRLSRQILQKNNVFVSKNVLVTRIALLDDYAYVAIPRFKPGIPVTLGKMRLKGNRLCEVSISPFPRWSLQEEGNCDSFQSVVDVFMDDRDVLWVLDTGIVNSIEAPIRKCSPKVAAIDPRTGTVIKTIDLGPLTTIASQLQYLVADYGPDDQPYVYVSDGFGQSIVVHNANTGVGFGVVLPSYVGPEDSHPDTLYLNLARMPDGTNSLIFSYLSGSRVYSLDTCYLQTGSTTEDTIVDLGPKKGKFVFLGTDNGCGIFYRKDGELDVYRWDLLEGERIKVYKGKTGELATHVAPDYRRHQMRLLLSNFHDYFKDTVGCGVDHVLDVF